MTLVVVAAAQVVGAGREFGPFVSAAIVAAVFGVALGLAWVLHRTVEQPLVRRFGRRRLTDEDRERCHEGEPATSAGTGTRAETTRQRPPTAVD
ncbi:hypothetical protein ACQP2P_15690 [Dactylosporangium sp. CA-139114]|uniref:hypothetical protein n=1 Tax=Dactylosporangium sp. CA-139114 TaxID=3239931 RepID=UPI003D954FB6